MFHCDFVHGWLNQVEKFIRSRHVLYGCYGCIKYEWFAWSERLRSGESTLVCVEAPPPPTPFGFAFVE